jgi:single-stranded-DNA-specific exonuclease
MADQQQQWTLAPSEPPPEWFIQAVRGYAPDTVGHYAAQMLWQRGIQDSQQLAGFVNPNLYQPANPFEFGQEMRWAVERLQRHTMQMKVSLFGETSMPMVLPQLLFSGMAWDSFFGKTLSYFTTSPIV